MTTIQNVLFLDAILAFVVQLWFRRHEPSSISSPSLLLVLAGLPALPLTLLLQTTSSILRSIFLAYGSFAGFILTFIAVYRLSPWHPLAKYPGPYLCKLSKFWAVYISYRGHLHIYHHDLHEKYGPIIRVGPNEISITKVDLIPFILGTQGMPKGPLWDGRIIIPSPANTNNNNLIGNRNLARHAEIRKPWNRAFSTDALKDYEEALVCRGLQLADILEESCNINKGIGNVDLAQAISFFSFDFMGDMAFGGGFELMRDGDKDKYWHNMENALRIPCLTQHIPWSLPLARRFTFVASAVKNFATFCRGRAEIRFHSSDSKKKDLFYHLMTAAEDKIESSSFALVMSNAMLTVVAGSDTTASVLSNIFYYLLVNPRYLALLQIELDHELPVSDDTTVDIDKLPSLPVLNGIINETLRLQPAVPTSLQRAPAKGSGGKMIGPSMFIPEGTSVVVPPYALHRDSRYFSPHPEEFWPERWMDQTSNVVLERAAFIPFSYGPANCAGKPLAILELRYIVALLIRKFNIAFQDDFEPSKWAEDLKDRFVLTKGKLPIRLEIRHPQS